MAFPSLPLLGSALHLRCIMNHAWRRLNQCRNLLESPTEAALGHAGNAVPWRRALGGASASMPQTPLLPSGSLSLQPLQPPRLPPHTQGAGGTGSARRASSWWARLRDAIVTPEGAPSSTPRLRDAMGTPGDAPSSTHQEIRQQQKQPEASSFNPAGGSGRLLPRLGPQAPRIPERRAAHGVTWVDDYR